MGVTTLRNGGDRAAGIRVPKLQQLAVRSAEIRRLRRRLTATARRVGIGGAKRGRRRRCCQADPRLRAGQRIGLLGGSFDPPHAGHVHISRWALKAFGLDRVWWLVSPGNPLKADAPADWRGGWRWRGR